MVVVVGGVREVVVEVRVVQEQEREAGGLQQVVREPGEVLVAWADSGGFQSLP